MGARDDPLAGLRAPLRSGRGRDGSPLRCAARSRSPACSSTSRSTRSAGWPTGSGCRSCSCTATRGRRTAPRSRRRTGAKVIKAARVSAGSDVQAMEAFHTRLPPARHAPRRPLRRDGGDVRLGARAAAPHRRVPLILSGGLKPENVAAAIAATQPFAVDVASGTEASPGVKDPAKLRAFAEAVARRRGGGVSAGGRARSIPHRYGPYGGQYVPRR